MLCSYYRGRTSFVELMNMPLDYINALYKIAEERQKAEQKKQEEEAAKGNKDYIPDSAAEQLQDDMEDALT